MKHHTHRWVALVSVTTFVLWLFVSVSVSAQSQTDICDQLKNNPSLLDTFTSSERAVINAECAKRTEQAGKERPVHLTYTTDFYRTRERLRARGMLPSAPSSTANMTYHNGSIMQTVTAYTIFWTPNNTITNGYRNLVNRYFTDINGSAFYNINTQYYQNPGPVYMQNNSGLGGTWIDTTNSGVGNGYPAGRGTAANPLTDADIRNEVSAAITANPTWGPPGLTRQYIVYYEQNIEQCFNATSCTSGVSTGQPAFCAYHSYFTSGGNTVIYANMPYVETWTTRCRSFSTSPNGNLAADAEISTSSHEHFEAATDPRLDAWYDSDLSGENGDKCAYRYGTTQSDGHNMVLNGNPYIIQLEWSNAALNTSVAFSGCVTRYNANVDVAVNKTAPVSVIAGNTLSYNISLTNNNTTFEATDVVLTDAVPANTTFVSFLQNTGPPFTCSLPTVGFPGTARCTRIALAPSASATFTLVVRVRPSAPNGSTISNTSSVTTTSGDPNASNNSALVTTTVHTLADVGVTKNATTNPVIAGTDETYNLTVNNTGPSDAQNVALTDATPTNTTFVSFGQTSGPAFSCTTPPSGASGTVSCTLATLPAGNSATFSFVVHVSPSAPDGSTLTNTASVASSTTDPNLANNAHTITTSVIARADLAVTKSATPDPAIAGTDETYNLTVMNPGPSDAQNVALTDATPTNTTFVSFGQTSGPAFSCTTPPSGASGTVSCTLATLPVGNSATFSFVVHVSPSAPDGSTLTNTASVASSTTDLNLANNAHTITTSVIARADLTITKNQTSDLVIADINETYNLTVMNPGPSDAQNVGLTDATPTNTTFVSFGQTSGPAFSCTTPPSGASGTVSCTLATLPAGAAATFTLVVRISPVDTPSISNQASVAAQTIDPDLGNNASKVTAVDSVEEYKQRVLTDLIALRGSVTNKQDGQKLDAAIKHLSNSLAASLWVDGNTLVAQSGAKVFREEQDSVGMLGNLIKQNRNGLADSLQEMVDRLVAADRALADIALNQAIEAGGRANHIAQAQSELAQGNANAGKARVAIVHYRNAWQHAQLAMKK